MSTDKSAEKLSPAAPANDNSSTVSSDSTLAHTKALDMSEKPPMTEKATSRPASITTEKNEMDTTTKEKSNPVTGSKEDVEEVEDESKYPGPVALGFIVLALCLAVFLVALVCCASARSNEELGNHDRS